uniref:Uncharacterized protein n=1 Tax=Oryza brachyantha TaxID=4533 RepID=J3M0B2_ORYBR
MVHHLSCHHPNVVARGFCHTKMWWHVGGERKSTSMTFDQTGKASITLESPTMRRERRVGGRERVEVATGTRYPIPRGEFTY